MTSMIPAWCDYCRHDRDDGTCAAFPDGIPENIAMGDPHSSPVEWQGNDVVFTLDSSKQEQFTEDEPYLSTAAEPVG